MSAAPHRPAARRLRRRLLLAGALPSLLALLVAARLATLVLWNEQGQQAWAEREAAVAADLFARNGVAAPVERWVAPFNEGGSLALDGDLPRARSVLEESLAVVPPRHECLVRVNLALVLEALGDRAAAAAPAGPRAAGSWTEGRAVIAAGGCETTVAELRERATGQEGAVRPSGAPDAARAARATRVDARLEDKLARLRQREEERARPPRRTSEQRRDADRLERLNDGAAVQERELREGLGPRGGGVEW